MLYFVDFFKMLYDMDLDWTKFDTGPLAIVSLST